MHLLFKSFRSIINSPFKTSLNDNLNTLLYKYATIYSRIYLIYSFKEKNKNKLVYSNNKFFESFSKYNIDISYENILKLSNLKIGVLAELIITYINTEISKYNPNGESVDSIISTPEVSKFILKMISSNIDHLINDVQIDFDNF